MHKTLGVCEINFTEKNTKCEIAKKSTAYFMDVLAKWCALRYNNGVKKESNFAG